jgi:MYXO-CTERM domain-containing protein
VRVSDGSGNIDVAHAVIQVAVSNEPPEITSLSPATPAPFAEPGQVIAFHVEASDPDGDPLSFEWRVDGAVAGTGQDFQLTMPDEEPHDVEVRVSDDDPWSPDARALSVVRAAKWQGGVGGGGSGAGAGGAGGGDGGGAGGPGGNGAGASSGGGDSGGGRADGGGEGCGCRTGNDGSEGGAVGALLLLGLAGWRRRAAGKRRA